MRAVIAGCFALLLAWPAAAQTPADPAFATAKAAFEGMMLAWLTRPEFPMREVLSEWAAAMRARLPNDT